MPAAILLSSKPVKIVVTFSLDKKWGNIKRKKEKKKVYIKKMKKYAIMSITCADVTQSKNRAFWLDVH